MGNIPGGVPNAYGKELILDLHHCDATRFTRRCLRHFFNQLCTLIDMEREDLHFWDDEGVPFDKREIEPHLAGISAIQFIRTSNITIHTLSLLSTAYLNIFSCKDFDANEAAEFCRDWFKGEIVNKQVITRK